MTLDAMHWVWTNSRSKGNTRVALLYVADQVRTTACEVRVGHRELMEALNTASKATAEAALKKGVELRELEIVEESSGRRPALYRLPKAVGYVRMLPSSAPEVGAQDSASAPTSGAQDPESRPRSAPKTGAQENASAPVFDASAPKTGAPPHTHKEQASGSDGQADAFKICQPLIQAMTEAGLTVTWQMQARDWLDIAAIVDRAGVKAMVDYAIDTKASTSKPIRYATFFLRGGWKGLPPKSTRPSSPKPDPTAGKPSWCEDTDCDPVTRTRDIENDRGLRFSQPCPKCHPSSRKDSAA